MGQPCRRCGLELDGRERTCPACGTRRRRAPFLTWLIGFAILFLGFLMLLSREPPP